MNIKHRKKTGAILIFSLMLASLMILLTEQLFRSVNVNWTFSRAMVDRERAEMLALSGLTIAKNQLTIEPEDKDDKKKKTQASQEASKVGEKKEEDTPVKKFLRRVLPNLNRWQVFTFEEKRDGIEGELKICISCEHGKINLNHAFDFKKQEFKKLYAALLKGLEIKGKVKAGEILQKLTEFLKERRKKLHDVSELNKMSLFKNFKIFYKPPEMVLESSGTTKKKEKAKPNPNIMLQDLFTIWTPDDKLEYLMFSDALCAIFGLRRPLANDADVKKDVFKKVIDTFKPDWGKNWDENSKYLQEIYDNKPKVLKQLQPLFSQQFEPTVYSVLSWAKVGSVEQKLLAIVKKTKHNGKKKEKDSKKKEQEKNNKDKIDKKDKESKKPESFFKVVRVYWL